MGSVSSAVVACTASTGLASERSGSGPRLVLLHGLGSDRTAWYPLCDRLAGHRELVLLDLPGHGGSGLLPPGAGWGVEAYTDVVATHLAALGDGPVHVAGNSLGGAVALELAARGAVASATALAPIGFWTSAEARYAATTLRTAQALARRLLPVAPLVLRSRTVRAALLAPFFAHPARLATGDVLAAVAAMAGSRAVSSTLPVSRRYRLSRTGFPCPVTIAWGTRDRLLVPRQARRARLRLPSARHVRLEDCGHVPMPEAPDTVAAVLLDGSRS